VPLACSRACALMWRCGYSLDNLSLMALTISVGFVVDDAIVMLENIMRHIEEGDADAGSAARLLGNRLHDHIDQPVAGRGADPAAADERHHRAPVREFAVTLTMAIAVSPSLR
jgi:HAE1 family hydrophobic/amphiphilic exporter-1